MRVATWIVGKLLYAVWVALMVATPLFGFWLASSLAAFENASLWLALGVGLLLFPLVPVGWELFYAWRRNRRGDVSKPILTRLDRVVLRTLIVNGLFLGLMMWRAPHTAFRALAVRGDWILDGQDGPIATRARGIMLGFADRFEQRWHTDSTTFGTSDKPPPASVTDDYEPQPIPGVVLPIQPKDPNGWPYAEDMDPLVTAMPESEQTSVESVAAYFKARISDKKLLAKALHDYVINRLTYDKPTADLRDDEHDKRPSQAAADVFAAKTAVCEGYARLYDALGNAAGLNMAYITGYIRDAERHPSEDVTTDEEVKHALEGFLHAWNAVNIDGTWLLVDTTWDDPGDHYSTTYLFTPPRVFAYDHLSEDTAWQLVTKPLGTGEFARQPLLSPYVGVLGVTLESPKRSQVTTTDGEVEVKIGNPFRASLQLAVRDGEACVAMPSTELIATFKCLVPSGQHEIILFGGKGEHATRLRSFGSILVNSR
jgi:transglutaminase-like putative cysteine protease